MLGQAKAAEPEGVGEHHVNITSQQPAEVTGNTLVEDKRRTDCVFFVISPPLTLQLRTTRRSSKLRHKANAHAHTEMLGDARCSQSRKKIVTIYSLGHFYFTPFFMLAAAQP